MTKKLMLSLLTAGLMGTAAQAQHSFRCATDEFHKAQIALHPEIAAEEARMNQRMEALQAGYLPMAPMSKWAKTTFNPEDALRPWNQDTTQYYIPMVVHVIYESAGDAVAVKDEDIYGWVDRLNSYYNATDPALSSVIAPWKPYIGNARIKFIMANKDPKGNPTRGIVRHYSYHSNGGDESAKIDQWPPQQYLNVYLENFIGKDADQGVVLAYATFPTDFSANPYSQGVISRADQLSPGGDAYTLAHEIGHYLFLYHPWNFGGAGAGSASCGDDEVDDTPPTRGHFSTCPLYDTVCSKGYLKDYDSVTFYHMIGKDGVIAKNAVVSGSSVIYDDSLNKIGQTFTTGPDVVSLASIKLFFDTSASINTKIGNVGVSLYNSSGSTLIAKSLNSQLSKSIPMLAFNFANIPLTPNTTYKFIVDTVGSGHRIFGLRRDSTNTYAGGMMYGGANAAVAQSGSDLYFQIDQLRRIDYPDTNNTQNIMDYSSCKRMFTKGQVGRMRDALREDVRRPLMDTSNLIRTGVMNTSGALVPPTDLSPIALYTVNRPFTCRNSTLQGVTFSNRSYNDTIASASWTFDKGATNPTSTNTSSVYNSFSETGWVTASLTVTGNGTGSNTYTRNDMVYVADDKGIAPYIEEFNQTDMLSRYPLFDYFKHPYYSWEVCNTAGYYDKTSLRFRNYDKRDQGGVVGGTELNTAYLSPKGLYADFYTPAFNLTGFGGNCFLSFYSAGAFRTAKNSYINDTLLVSYTTNCGLTWTPLPTGRIGRSDLGNKGYVDVPFEPLWMGDWKEQSLSIPSDARTEQVYFRFRFLPGTDNAQKRYGGLDFGTGNNFYLDRLSVTANPLTVKNGVIVKLGMTVTPNPTNGAATVRINGGDNSSADINVTDVTGKLVYHTTVVRSAQSTEVEIPATALAAKGVYLVHVVTNGATETRKLVAY